MQRRFAISATLGALAALVGLAVLTPFPTVAQEQEEKEEREAREHEMRVLSGGPGGLVMAARSGGYLGIRITDVDDEEVERLGLDEERGALVVEVVDETPASEAGLEIDDVIVRWNDESVASAAEFSRLVRETPSGRAVRLGVIRDGGERQIEAELGDRTDAVRSFRMRAAPQGRLRRLEGPARMRIEGPGAWVFRMGRPRLGVSVTGMSEQLAEYFGVAEGDGALVTEVHDETPAERAGLRAGDVILRVAGEEVDGPGDISRILADRDAGPVGVEIVRDRQERSITVELEERDEGPGGAALLAPGAFPEAPRVELEVAPIPTLPPIEAPRFEIEVSGEPGLLDPERWEEWGGAWEAWAEDLAERAKKWGASLEESLEGWSESWEDELREWEESLPEDPVEVTYEAGPIFL